MKAVKANVVRALNVGSIVKVVDNSGAKLAKIIAVKGYKGVRKRLAKAGVGDVVVVSIIEGRVSGLQKNITHAVIIRQKKPYKRKDGTTIKFEDNAVIILKDIDTYEPKGSIIKGPVAREVAERFTPIAKIATLIV